MQHTSRFTVAAFAVVAVIASICGMANAQDPIQRKSGLWEIRMAAGAPPMTQCVDHSRDGMMAQWGAQLGKDFKCTQINMQKAPGRISFESSCQMMGTTSKSTTVVTGDLDSAYRMETSSKYDPPFMGKSEGKMTIDAKWVGPCKPGQRPGDTTMPGGGMTMNVYDMMDAKK